VNKPHHPLAPFLVACVAIALFSVMDAVVKHLAIVMGAYNAMLWRQMAASTMGGIGFVATKSRIPEWPVLKISMIRGGIAAVMAFTFFWGIVRVPLAEGIALSFIAPLIALYLAAVLLGEKIAPKAIIASIMGILGVAITAWARLDVADHDREVLMGIGSILISAVLYAYNIILQRQQAQLASPVQVAFLQTLFALMATATFAPFLAVVPPLEEVPFIIFAAALTYVSLYLLSWAYARAEAQALLPVEYTAFGWAVIMGWYFFDEAVTIPTLIGTGLIVAGCVIAARQPKPVEPTAA
jgi:S-adenosylmethionine uptake transporter